MKYPIAIEPGTDTTAWGVVVPDLPRRILALLDHKAKSAGETRSGYIAQMTLTH